MPGTVQCVRVFYAVLAATFAHAVASPASLRRRLGSTNSSIDTTYAAQTQSTGISGLNIFLIAFGVPVLFIVAFSIIAVVAQKHADRLREARVRVLHDCMQECKPTFRLVHRVTFCVAFQCFASCPGDSGGRSSHRGCRADSEIWGWVG